MVRGFKRAIGNVVHIAVVSDPVAHLFHAKTTVICHWFTSVTDELFLHHAKNIGDQLCLVVDLLDHAVCEILHELFRFHHLFQTHFVALIPHDQEFFTAPADPDCHLYQLDESFTVTRLTALLIIVRVENVFVSFGSCRRTQLLA